MQGIYVAFSELYNAIRGTPFLRACKILFVFENNYAHTCNLLMGHIQHDPNYQRCYFLRDKIDLPGFHTDELSSYKNRKLLQQSVATNNIVLARDMITCNTDPKFTQASVLREFKNQLNRLNEFAKRTGRRGPLVNKISSILDRDNKPRNVNDDIEMAFSIGLGAMMAFENGALPVNYNDIANLPPVRIIVPTTTAQLTQQTSKDRQHGQSSATGMMLREGVYEAHLPSRTTILNRANLSLAKTPRDTK